MNILNEFHNVFAFQKLLNCRDQISVDLDSIRPSSSYETQRILGDMVFSEQNTHHHLLIKRYDWKRLVNVKINVRVALIFLKQLPYLTNPSLYGKNLKPPPLYQPLL